MLTSSVITVLQMWDPESCECRCRPEEIKDCMTGYKYDGVFSCQCLPVPYSAGTPLLVVLGIMLVILVAAILISSSAQIKKINSNGVKKMCRNIFAVQHTLTASITGDFSFGWFETL